MLALRCNGKTPQRQRLTPLSVATGGGDQNIIEVIQAAKLYSSTWCDMVKAYISGLLLGKYSIIIIFYYIIECIMAGLYNFKLSLSTMYVCMNNKAGRRPRVHRMSEYVLTCSCILYAPQGTSWICTRVQTWPTFDGALGGWIGYRLQVPTTQAESSLLVSTDSR